MKKLLVFLLFALLTAASAQAQDELPLILWIRGDLYAVESDGAAPVPLTTNSTISGPALAPGGVRIAYKAAAQVGINALDRVEAEGFIANFDLPGDIYLFDLTTRAPVQIVGQPADASLFVEGVTDHATIRSAPVWSPDGTRLAWTEVNYPNGTPAIMVYDLSSGTLTPLASSIPAPLVQGAAPPLRWGINGIAINASADGAGEQDFLIYSNEGQLRAHPRLAPVEADPVLDFVWVEAANGSLLGILYQSGRWTLLDGVSGVAQPFAEIPRLTTNQPDTRALTFGVDPNEGFYWEIVGETAAAVGAPTQVTLSPSGRQIAFIGFPSSGGVSVWQNGEAEAIPNTGSNLEQLQVGAVLWGYTIWRTG